jgi:hypothetical protein
MYDFNVFLIVLTPLYQWLSTIQTARRPPQQDVLTGIDDPRNSYLLHKTLHSQQEAGDVVIMRASQLLAVIIQPSETPNDHRHPTRS